MKIATYNIDGINGRIDNLLRWLGDELRDVVCIRELKAPDEKFPARQIGKVATGRFGTASVLGTVSRSLPKTRSRC